MLGWSDGGITALCAAIQQPKAIEKVLWSSLVSQVQPEYMQVVVWGSNAYLVQEDIDMIKQVFNVEFNIFSFLSGIFI